MGMLTSLKNELGLVSVIAMPPWAPAWGEFVGQRERWVGWSTGARRSRCEWSPVSFLQANNLFENLPRLSRS